MVPRSGLRFGGGSDGNGGGGEERSAEGMAAVVAGGTHCFPAADAACHLSPLLHV